MPPSWKHVCGIPEYEVSDDGRVRNTATQKLLSQYRNGSDDALSVSFSRQVCPRNRNHRVSRLVAEAFLELGLGRQVAHIDGDKDNLSPGNLCWKGDAGFTTLPEECRPVPGFAGYYAGESGSLYSSDRNNSTGRSGEHLFFKIAGTPNRNGYLQTTAAKDGGRAKTVRLHSLVALAWHGEPPFTCALVRHLNDVKMDNRPSNLAYGTPLQNSMDAIANGRQKIGTESASAKITSEQLSIVRQLRAADRTYREIREFVPLSLTQIGNICRGEQHRPPSV